MKITMVIPSYWGRESNVGWKEGDFVYDHPTPLDSEGTLGRAIESTSVLEDTDFELVILVAPTAPGIADRAEEKVADIINSSFTGINVRMFGPSHLRKLHENLQNAGLGEYHDLLSLYGYSNIRNMCLFLPHIMGSDVALLIDDDEVFEDPRFISRAREFIGKEIGGTPVEAVAGYYLQPDGDYHVSIPDDPWAQQWGKNACMNTAFDDVIGTSPRLKETPFVFGGNMAIHRNLFMQIPFDPAVPRGEDIDYLLNASMFGHSFFLDNELSIKHLPPEKSHPAWKRMREDIARFVYERAKIRSQKPLPGMTEVRADDLGSYPGKFLGDDLEEKVTKACHLLAEEYRQGGDPDGYAEALKNIEYARTEACPEFDPFAHLCTLQKRWSSLMEQASDIDTSCIW